MAVVTGSFEDLAYRMREHNDHHDLNILVLPYPLEDRPQDYIREAARDAYPQLLSMLGATVG